MCRRVQQQPGFDSIQLPGGAGPAPACHQHADDTTLHAASVASAKRLLDEAVKPFCQASGASLNVSKCKGLLLGGHPPLQLQPDSSGQLVEATTGVRFPDTATEPIRHLGVPLSAGGVEQHAARLYSERLRTITWRVRLWSRYQLSLTGRCEVARQVLANCLCFHTQFVPPPPEVLRPIQRRIEAFILGLGCLSGSDDRRLEQTPRAAVARLPRQMGGFAQVDVAAHAQAMQAKVAARLLHPARAAWKQFMAAAMERALPSLGVAALVQADPAALRRCALSPRRKACALALARAGVHRHVPHELMSLHQVRLELLVGNHSVGAARGGALLASESRLAPPLRRGAGTCLGQVAGQLQWRPQVDGIVLPSAWQQTLNSPPPPGWQALRQPGQLQGQQPEWVRRRAPGRAETQHFRVRQDGSMGREQAPAAVGATAVWEECCVADTTATPHPAAPARQGQQQQGAPSGAPPPPPPLPQRRAPQAGLYFVGCWGDIKVDPGVWGLGPDMGLLNFTVRGACRRLLQVQCAAEVGRAGGWVPGVGVVPRLWRGEDGQVSLQDALLRLETGQKRSWEQRRQPAPASGSGQDGSEGDGSMPAWMRDSPARQHVRQRVEGAAAAAAAATAQRQQQEQRQGWAEEPAVDDLADPLTGEVGRVDASAHDWAACYRRVHHPRLPRRLRSFGWGLLHAGLRVGAARVFSHPPGAAGLAELACPNPACRQQPQPPLETLTHMFCDCPVAGPVLAWYASVWGRLQPGLALTPSPRVMLQDDFASSQVAVALQPLWTHLRLLLLESFWVVRRAAGGQPGHTPAAVAGRFVAEVRRQVRRDWQRVGVDVRWQAGVPLSWLRGRDPVLSETDFQARWCHRGVIAWVGAQGMTCRLTAAGLQGPGAQGGQPPAGDAAGGAAAAVAAAAAAAAGA